MLLNKLKVATVVLLMLGEAGSGIGIVTYHAQAAEAVTKPLQEKTPREANSARAASIPPGGGTTQSVELGTLGGAAVLVRIGAVLDGVMLDKLNLTDEVKAKARQALRTWYLNEMAEARKQVRAQMAGTDAGQRARLEEAVKDYSTPYRSAQTLRSYAGARAALKESLNGEQLRRLDGLVKTATSDMIVNHYILAAVARWKKDQVVLTADQQAQIDAIIAGTKAQAAVIAAGDEVGVRKILNRLPGDLNRVLTPAQRVQVMHPTP